MQYTANAVNVAIEELTKLPGIGRKSAQRLVFFLLKCDKEEIISLANSLQDLTEKIQFCKTCFNIAEAEQCSICSNSARNHNTICVVEEANDVLAIEKTNEYRGTYHVLGGVLSPLDGIGPDDIHVRELMQRLNDETEEVILAMNASAEGEATAVYLSKFIKPLDIKISRIARGIPMGGDLEYTDELTLARALAERVHL